MAGPSISTRIKQHYRALRTRLYVWTQDHSMQLLGYAVVVTLLWAVTLSARADERLYLVCTPMDQAGQPPAATPAPTPPPAPGPAPTPQPQPEPDPAGVTKFEDLNWGQPGSQERIPLVGDQVKYSAITATQSPRYGGQISVASTTGNSGVMRRVWISEAPGGDPMNRYCEAEGTSSTVVRWYQGPPRDGYCPLTPGRDYYIHYQNQNCPQGQRCDVTRIIYNNGRS